MTVLFPQGWDILRFFEGIGSIKGLTSNHFFQPNSPLARLQAWLPWLLDAIPCPDPREPPATCYERSFRYSEDHKVGISIKIFGAWYGILQLTCNLLQCDHDSVDVFLHKSIPCLPSTLGITLNNRYTG